MPEGKITEAEDLPVSEKGRRKSSLKTKKSEFYKSDS